MDLLCFKLPAFLRPPDLWFCLLTTVNRVLLALLVLLVFLAHVDLLGLKVLLGLWVPKASR